MLPTWRRFSLSQNRKFGSTAATVSKSSRRRTSRPIPSPIPSPPEAIAPEGATPEAATPKRSPLLHARLKSVNNKAAAVPRRRKLLLEDKYSLEGPFKVGERLSHTARSTIAYLTATVVPANFFPGFKVHKVIVPRRYWIRYYGLSQAPIGILLPDRSTFSERVVDTDDQEPERAEPNATGQGRKAKAKAMHNYVQVLSAPTTDSGPTLLLHFQNRRYMFGRIAEGTQRVLVQRRESITKMEDIFITGDIDWSSIGGLLGMILTVADVNEGVRAATKEYLQKKLAKDKAKGKEVPDSAAVKVGMAELTVHGASRLTHALATARNFIFRKGLPLRVKEFMEDVRATEPSSSTPDWEDENIKVWKVPFNVESPRDQKSSISNGPLLPILAGKKRSFDELETEDQDGAEMRSYKSPDDKAWEAMVAADMDAKRQAAEEEDTRVLTPKERADEQAMREGVLAAMFTGDTIDSLKAARLRDVTLPADIFVRDEKGHIKQYEGPLPGDPECPDIPVLIKSRQVLHRLDFLPRPEQGAKTCMNYIVKCQPRRGKFNPGRAKELGVVPRDFSKLAKKEPVTGKDGIIVTPDMVLEPDVEGHGFAVLDMKNDGCVKDLDTRPEWSNPDIMKGIDLMYWLFSNNVEEHPMVADFMKKHSDKKHVVLSTQMGGNPLVFESAAVNTFKLNRIDPARFPLPLFENKKGRTVPNLHGFVRIGRPGQALQLIPQVLYDETRACKYADTEAPLRELEAMPDVLELADAAQRKIADAAFVAEVDKIEEGMPSRDAEIVTLGTGSALPSKYRNVSATLLRVPGHGSWLFDCGENTLGQLQRAYGPEGTREILADLRGIFISHLHADHHLGVVSVLQAWQMQNAPVKGDSNVTDKSLLVVANDFFLDFLTEFRDVQAFGWSHIITMTTGASAKVGKIFSPRFTTALYNKRSKELLGNFGLADIDVCSVDHTAGSRAVVYRWQSGLKVAYSGDCRPSRDFARIGRRADLLIHECTFDDALRGDALAKKHSTMSEALGVARDMAARRVMLTHFSQRYPKAAVMSDDARDIIKGCDMSVLCAFDGMRVKLGEFRHAEQFLPAIKRLFEDDPLQKA